MEVELGAFQQYYVQPYPGRVTLFRTHAQPLLCPHDPTMGWQPLALGGVHVCDCPGSHHTLLKEPFVRGLAAGLCEYLKKADASMKSMT